MKQIILYFLVLIVLFSNGALTQEIKPLSKIGPVDQEALDLMKGYWVLDDGKTLLQFTDHFACMIDGLKYFHYHRPSSRSSYPMVYTIIKSRETGYRYFARGRYVDGRFLGSTARVAFKGKDRLIVYRSNKPKEVFYVAKRVQVEKADKGDKGEKS